MQAFLTALRFSFLIMIISGLVYPLVITGLGQWVFPAQSNGSLIKSSNGVLIGSKLIGQNFTRPEYFQPRPSTNGYDAANSGGANLGVTSKKLVERILSDAKRYQGANSSQSGIPVDVVTASGSGLDPHISLANALAQAPRVAAARQLPVKTVTDMVMGMKETALAETPYVNVLSLNLALDRQLKHRSIGAHE